jgi:hypothetical protein
LSLGWHNKYSLILFFLALATIFITQNTAHELTHLASYGSSVIEECNNCTLFKGTPVVLVPDFPLLAPISAAAISKPLLNVVWPAFSYYLSRAPPLKFRFNLINSF